MEVASEQHERDAGDLDQIRADRACIGCGFNLYGQTVSKEEHYGLAIARCPECGTVAALQQYPLMSHWVNRFRAILAALWIVLLLGTFGLSTMAISGFAISISEVASNPLGDYIGLSFTQWQEDQAAGATPAGTAGNVTPVITRQMTGSYQWVTVSPEWYDIHLDSCVASFGNLWANMDRGAYIFLVPAGVVSLLLGVYWSIALLGASRLRALCVLVLAALIGGVFVISFNTGVGNFPWASNIAEEYYAVRIVPFVMIYQLLWMGVGLFFGRMVARFVVCLALPARSRVPLGVLWTRDGLSPPSPVAR